MMDNLHELREIVLYMICFRRVVNEDVDTVTECGTD